MLNTIIDSSLKSRILVLLAVLAVLVFGVFQYLRLPVDAFPDIYFARQLVNERLSSAMNELPEMHEPPVLGPISTGLGQIFIYYLTLDEGTDTGGKPPNTYLREINDWVVKFQLQTVPGVTAILSIGGHVLQYQLRVDPFALQKYGLSLDDLVEAVRENNRNAGGQFLLLGSEEHLVRGIGLLQNLDGEESPHPGGVAGDFGPPGFSW